MRRDATSFDTLRRVANVLSNTRQTETLCQLEPLALVKAAMACMESGWDVTPDDLTNEELGLALAGLTSILEKTLTARLEGEG